MTCVVKGHMTFEVEVHMTCMVEVHMSCVVELHKTSVCVDKGHRRSCAYNLMVQAWWKKVQEKYMTWVVWHMTCAGR